MTLIGHGTGYGVASGWRPLLWFWCSVASAVVVGGTVLALLGPPSEPAVPQAIAANPSAPSKPPARRVANALVLPEVSVATPAVPPPAPPLQPGRPPRERAAAPLYTAPLDAPAPGAIVQQDAPPRARAAVVLHPARGESGAALADRLAARAGIAAGQVGVGDASEGRSEAAIRFYSETDHEFARRLGRELGGMGYTWKLQNYSQRSGAPRDGAIEVWLPNR